MDDQFTPQFVTRKGPKGHVLYRLNRDGKWFAAKDETTPKERYMGRMRRGATFEKLEVTLNDKTWHPVEEAGIVAAIDKIIALRQA